MRHHAPAGGCVERGLSGLLSPAGAARIGGRAVGASRRGDWGDFRAPSDCATGEGYVPSVAALDG